MEEDPSETAPEDPAASPETLYSFYVYELYDSKTGDVFYVGEGQGDRIDAHIHEAKRLCEQLNNEKPVEGRFNKDKIIRICDLLKKESIKSRIIGRFTSKNEARAVETVLINWIYGIEDLTNISKGRGSKVVRPKEKAFDEIQGIDTEKKIRVYGRTGYLSEKIENHNNYGHYGMAEEICNNLRKKFPKLHIEDPCFWEAGRYISVFVTLVPNKIRMTIQLTDSPQNQHVYSLKPMSETKAGREEFRAYLNHNSRTSETVKPHNDNRYARLPKWEGLRVLNTNLEEIEKQVSYALTFFPPASD